MQCLFVLNTHHFILWHHFPQGRFHLFLRIVKGDKVGEAKIRKMFPTPERVPFPSESILVKAVSRLINSSPVKLDGSHLSIPLPLLESPWSFGISFSRLLSSGTSRLAVLSSRSSLTSWSKLLWRWNRIFLADLVKWHNLQSFEVEDSNLAECLVDLPPLNSLFCFRIDIWAPQLAQKGSLSKY